MEYELKILKGKGIAKDLIGQVNYNCIKEVTLKDSKVTIVCNTNDITIKGVTNDMFNKIYY